MMRTFRYPLHPTAEQEAVLDGWLWHTRDLHNAALEERITAWEREKKSITFYDQCKSLTQVRAADSVYDEMPAVMSRGPLRRLDRSMKAFFKRCKSGETPGFPRFKGRDRWHSLDFAESFDVHDGKVRLAKLGDVKFNQYRPLKGKPLACVIKRERNKWFVCFQCELPDVPKVPVKRDVGIDLNLENLIVTSDHEVIKNPREGKKAAGRLADLQRALSRKKRGSKNRQKCKHQLGAAYEKVRNSRLDAIRKFAARLFAEYDMVFHEDLNVKGLLAKQKISEQDLTKSIVDAAWALVIRCLTLKAENAGKWAVPVDPRNTSKKCSHCGALVPKVLWQRMHTCPHCGLVLDRDVNAALNILASGRDAVGNVPTRRLLEAQTSN